MKVIVLKASGEVTQADLENILTVRAQIARLRSMEEKMVASVLARITAGAPVESGNRSCDIDVSFTRSCRKQVLRVV